MARERKEYRKVEVITMEEMKIMTRYRCKWKNKWILRKIMP